MNTSILNGIDIPKLFTDKIDIFDLMDIIEKKYGYQVFNDISFSEFIDYLREKYPKLNIVEKTQYIVTHI